MIASVNRFPRIQDGYILPRDVKTQFLSTSDIPEQ